MGIFEPSLVPPCVPTPGDSLDHLNRLRDLGIVVGDQYLQARDSACVHPFVRLGHRIRVNLGALIVEVSLTNVVGSPWRILPLSSLGATAGVSPLGGSPVSSPRSGSSGAQGLGSGHPDASHTGPSEVVGDPDLDFTDVVAGFLELMGYRG